MANMLKKFTPALKEIRIHMCSRSTNSNGVRQFLDKYYTGIKQNNPSLPILVRECSGIQPKIWFRFEHGRETSEPLTDLQPDQIAGIVKDKVTM